MKYTVDIDLLDNEDLYCEALSEILGMEFPEDAFSTIYKRRLLVEKKPELALKFFDYLFNLVEDERAEPVSELEIIETPKEDTKPEQLNLYAKEVKLTSYQLNTLDKIKQKLDEENFVV